MASRRGGNGRGKVAMEGVLRQGTDSLTPDAQSREQGNLTCQIFNLFFRTAHAPLCYFCFVF